MKISILRELMKKYQGTFYLRKWYAGDHQEAVSIMRFLDARSEKPDNYELPMNDLYELAGLLPENSQLSFIAAIKKSFHDLYLFPIFHALNKPGVLNAELFSEIYRLSSDDKQFLAQAFCYGDVAIRPSRQALRVVLFVCSQVSTYMYDDFSQALVLLDKHHLINDFFVSLVVAKKNDLLLLADLIKLLNHFSLLNEQSLTYFANQSSLSDVVEILKILKSVEVMVEGELFQPVMQERDLFNIVEYLMVIARADSSLLNNDVIALFLKQGSMIDARIMPLLKYLAAADMLTESRLMLMFGCKALSGISSIARMLSEAGVLSRCGNLIDLLLNNGVDPAKYYNVVNYLKILGLLKDEELDKYISWSHDQAKQPLFRMIQYFLSSQIVLTREQFNYLISLSHYNLDRILMLMTDLVHANILNQDNFKVIFDRVTLKLPAVKMSDVQKTSKKISGEARSSFLIDNWMSLFIESDPAKKYKVGGFSKVKKGYLIVDDVVPQYGIKKLNNADPVQSEHEAAREVKYQKFLGRDAYYFKNKWAFCVVSTWQFERPLDEFQPDELSKLALEQRLKCLISAWTDLNKLHASYRIHNDVKCANFILDINNTTLRLIDFGGTHKPHSRKDFAMTIAYRDPFGGYFKTFHDDVYAMSIVIARLFPELYQIEIDNPIRLISLPNTSGSQMLDQAIITLINYLRDPVRPRRPTSDDALRYCQLLLSNLASLDPSTLQQISAATIDRTTTTVEDICRESFRADVK